MYMEKECPTCGAELTGISETFSSDGKKISKNDNYSYGISYVNHKEHNKDTSKDPFKKGTSIEGKD